MRDRTITPDLDDPIDRAVSEFQRGIRRMENYERIFRRYCKPVQAFLSKRGLSHEICEELNQEVFLKVYTGMDGFAWKSKFASWLFTIAVNACRNWCGAESRRQRLTPAGVSNGLLDSPEAEHERVAIDDSADPQDEQLAKEREELLLKAVGKLPPQKRECVRLRLREFSYQEIADSMELSTGTVKAHLSQAREFLRKELGDYFDDIDF